MKAAEVAIAGLLKELKFLDNDEVKKLISQRILNSAGLKTGNINWIES